MSKVLDISVAHCDACYREVLCASIEASEYAAPEIVLCEACLEHALGVLRESAENPFNKWSMESARRLGDTVKGLEQNTP